jgi:hypothetical protein
MEKRTHVSEFGYDVSLELFLSCLGGGGVSRLHRSPCLASGGSIEQYRAVMILMDGQDRVPQQDTAHHTASFEFRVP